ncbi:uncharacterized protein SAPINGB_P001925 [Magnusiomyces paraingens]|uniref:Enoyl-CoA hydratase n=1 Tax=Magnusiomyces paraingens TaxID=2606893 RepID=A0A5E8BJ45_9ASCO|nr:uncharacterized protein SAPINGB_P001925 [Saprochaete ingens]VVT48735.1 unnamed protein product [Saprochaete ingens]
MSFPIAFPSSEKPWVYVSVSADDSYYLLEYNSPPDNRYTQDFVIAYLDALDYIRTKGTPRILVTTSRIPKFFSNGLDFEAAISTKGFFPNYYYRLMRTILLFPWPTVALINGHAFAAGFMVAACHDYRVMNPSKGFVCMNEVAFGADLKPPMMSIFRVKFGTQLTAKITLRAHRFPGAEALETGIVDALGGLPEVETLIKHKEISSYVKSPSYAAIRIELLKEVIADTWRYDEDIAKEKRDLESREAYFSKREKEIDAKLSKL